MSASLVGSEMCIRDRARGSRSRGRSRRARGPLARARPPGPTSASRTWAVSYTHLTLPTICSV
eukprot:14906679-Alexandrium_andersonii.AAC.1